jgi:hypothetical protein
MLRGEAEALTRKAVELALGGGPAVWGCPEVTSNLGRQAPRPRLARRERASSGARLLALMIDEGVTGHAFSRQLVELRRTQINVAGAQAH